MHLLDPKLGGKVRAIVAVLSTVAVILTSPAVADLGFPWVASVLAGVNAALDFLTHFTSVGNQEG